MASMAAVPRRRSRWQRVRPVVEAACAQASRASTRRPASSAWTTSDEHQSPRTWDRNSCSMSAPSLTTATITPVETGARRCRPAARPPGRWGCAGGSPDNRHRPEGPGRTVAGGGGRLTGEGPSGLGSAGAALALRPVLGADRAMGRRSNTCRVITEVTGPRTGHCRSADTHPVCGLRWRRDRSAGRGGGPDRPGACPASSPNGPVVTSERAWRSRRTTAASTSCGSSWPDEPEARPSPRSASRSWPAQSPTSSRNSSWEVSRVTDERLAAAHPPVTSASSQPRAAPVQGICLRI